MDFFSNFFRFSADNFFWWFILISFFFWGVEIVFPWRKTQSAIREDFWLDGFYMLFNMYIAPLLFLNFFVAIVNKYFLSFTELLGVASFELLSLQFLPWILQMLFFFLLRDFVHFNIHRLLHRIDFLWEIHKLHHSVKQMGFAAHLRFHLLEGLVYRILEYIPLGILGLSVRDYTILYVFTLFVGHFNHSNFKLPLGFLKYIFNNPQMHIWHHAKELPRRYGANFGLTLSLWDYLFKTDYIPKDGRDIELGFLKDESYPNNFWFQLLYGLGVRKNIISENKF